jgi:hypothetical protein
MAKRTDPDTTATAFDRLREAPALEKGPGVEEWTVKGAPGAGQVKGALEGLGLVAVVVEGRDALRFEGWKTPSTAALGVTVGLAVVVLGLFLALGVVSLVAAAFVLAAVFAILFGLLPEYRVTGWISRDRILVRLVSKGLLARRREMESALKRALGAS